MLPDFILVGASRSGTTTIFSILDKHPEIFLPPNKGLFFFERDINFNKGFDYTLWYDPSSGSMNLGGAIMLRSGHKEWPETNECGFRPHIAKQMLGINDRIAIRLFYETEWPEELRLMAEKMKTKQQRTDFLLEYRAYAIGLLNESI